MVGLLKIRSNWLHGYVHKKTITCIGSCIAGRRRGCAGAALCDDGMSYIRV